MVITQTTLATVITLTTLITLTTDEPTVYMLPLSNCSQVFSNLSWSFGLFKLFQLF